MKRSWRFGLVAIAVVATAVGLSFRFRWHGKKADLAPAPPAVEDWTDPPGSSFHASFTENTVVVDKRVILKSVRAASRENGILLFDASSSEIRNLAPGKVLLFPA